MTHDITLRLAMQDGTIREIELTPEQAFDLKAGKGLPAYFLHDGQILPHDDGTITCRESAIPEVRDSA